ncbi:MAG: hypothetical protein N2442_05755 [Spirochaetes bacterium]|nr:hypothetical protein [Spirochaetota bacterium]
MRVFQLPILLSVATLLFSHCSTQTDFIVNSDGSGELSLRIELSPILLRYYSDLATGFLPNYDPKHPRIFDLEALRLRFAQEKNLSLTSARTPSPERLEATFTFKNLETLFADPKMGNAISLERKAREETLRINLNRDTLKAILALAPDTQSPMFRMLLPSENKPLNEGEYRKQLIWALEEYASEQELSTTLQRSRIEVRIRTPAPILRQKGGIQEGPSTIRFTLPLLTLLTTPLEYELTYQR